VYQFAFSAVDRIASAPKPSLIILQNKCGQSSQLNVDVHTTFFSRTVVPAQNIKCRVSCVGV
jgi:hypothetical protein